MYIEAVEYIYGKKSVDLTELVGLGEISLRESMVYSKVFGLQQVRRATLLHHESFIKSLLLRLVEKSVLKTTDVEYVMFAHTADLVAPIGKTFLSTIVTEAGFTQARCFDSTGYNCVSPFLLMTLSSNLLQTLNKNQKIILLIGDLAYTSILKTIPGATLMSDAAALVVLSHSSTNHRYICSVIEPYGRFAKGIWADHETQLNFQDDYVSYLANLVIKVIQKGGVSVADISLILPHNVNITSWLQLAERLSLSHSKIYLDNIAKYAHAFGADPFINLKDSVKKNKLFPGDYYLLVSVGLGAVFAAALFQY